jgi:4a-hydroxytetrahydrobiopterin dehydratase
MGITPRHFAIEMRGTRIRSSDAHDGRHEENLDMAKLSEDQIKQKLKALPGWESKNNAISKMFKFKEFLHGIEFVQKVAEIAEGADHHPDITINYTRVTFSCSTHDAGGVTDKDFKLAENIEIAFKDRAD